MSGLGPSDTAGGRQGRGSTQALGTAVGGGVQVFRGWNTRPPSLLLWV